MTRGRCFKDQASREKKEEKKTVEYETQASKQTNQKEKRKRQCPRTLT